MSRKPASTKVTEDCTMRVLGGREMTMKEYAEYMQALSAKPFLTVHEASIFFNIGVNKLYKLMKDPSCDYVVDAGHLNVPAKQGGRELGWPKPKGITGVQAAMLVFEYERIRMVCTKETVDSPTAEGVIAMYINSGNNAGIQMKERLTSVKHLTMMTKNRVCVTETCYNTVYNTLSCIESV